MNRDTSMSDQPARIRSLDAPALSRREMLRLIGALCLAPPIGVSVQACSKSSPEPEPPLSGPPTLAQLRALIRSSAAHLQARAEEVAATKDVKRIAEFVRDHIAAEWTSGTLDETLSRAIDALASEKHGRSDYLATIGEFVPSLEFFDRSPSALLAHPAFSGTESTLATSFAEFGHPA